MRTTGMSARDLAAHLGLKVNTVYCYMCGVRKPNPTAQKLLRELARRKEKVESS